MLFLNALQTVLEPLPTRGKGRLAVAVLSRIGQREVQCHPLPGVTVCLRADKWIEQLMWAGAYEPELVNLFKKVLKPGMIVLDVGANIGYFSALAAALVGNCGQVHAFEPAPPCVPRLKKNLVPFPWAHAYFNAVGDELCTTRLYYSDRGNETGWGSLLSKENTSTDETMVSMVRLDDWASSRAVRRIDFIKLDIEGGEYRALKGAESLLRQYRPVVVAELNDVCLRRDSRMPQDVLLLLRTMQYNTFSFNDGVLGIPKDGASQTGALHEFTREPL